MRGWGCLKAGGASPPPLWLRVLGAVGQHLGERGWCGAGRVLPAAFGGYCSVTGLCAQGSGARSGKALKIILQYGLHTARCGVVHVLSTFFSPHLPPSPPPQKKTTEQP